MHPPSHVFRGVFVEGEDGEIGMVSSAIDSPSPEESLTPLARLKKDINSDNVFNRQMVARGLLDTLRTVCDNEDDREAGLEAMSHLSEDIEPMVRAELMEQIPHIAMLCHEHQHLFPSTIQDYILPTVVRYLTDTNNQVRKTSQAALLVLLEQELVGRHDMEDQVCPVIVQLSSQDSSDDYRTEAVALMSKVAPLVGKDITENYFLPQFTELCKDSLFHIRKVCAANFGDICSVVGEEATEKLLLPRFEALCEDGVWGVRKACAECFMTVSWATSKPKRERELSNLFVHLLRDQSRWVRMAAFQALGPFISTFADPSISGIHLLYNADGTVQVAGVVPIDDDITSNKQTNNYPNNTDNRLAEHMVIDERSNSNSRSNKDGASNEQSTSRDRKTLHQGVGELNFKVGDGQPPANDDSPEYSSFLFWRQPVPVLGTGGKKKSSTDKEEEKAKEEKATEENKGETIEMESVETSSQDSKDSEDDSRTKDDRFTSTTQFAMGSSSSSNTGAAEKSLPDSGISSPEAVHEDNDNPASGEGAESKELKKDIQDLVQTISQMNLEGNGEDAASSSQSNDGEQTEADGNVKLHTADVSEANDITEMVMHLPSTQTLEQRIDDKTLSFVNGVLEEEEELNEWAEVEPSLNQVSPKQDVIPHMLLENYLSMTDPRIAQAVDTEIAKHCAYSLPGVALTLGRKNWYCLKDIYETLSSDMQWKVRRTLAFSIHEMALILGDSITSSDLVPIFNGFLRDLDEVRIGVLKHFADFVKLLQPELRRQYLNRMTDFLTTDNQRNWRFRLELAEQLILLCDLYDPSDVCDNILPIAMSLAGDRVADVRFTSYKLLSVIAKIVLSSNNGDLRQTFVQEVVTNYAQSSRWAYRQAFCHLCQRLLQDQAVEPNVFAVEFLPSLLQLEDDPIPNVRLTLARTVTEYILLISYFDHIENPYREHMLACLSRLRGDEDRDVRFYSCLGPSGDTKVHYAEGELPV
ncbi:serine/threonine-protein phosphatase 4 regulatory subunit 1 isoform X3 [Strongylocentrotus purpuratus]|uniref:Phosphatase 2A Regulatory Subunit A helical domain-containing protein n=1 Tax=Strongylocentrotus purpuratus TaxID=7668 RepID=A0A7M7SU76_STRPU|nr:serine/threonine-protein phosphatase 4 regulatory subunit 1 isoform X3 [Strongylocentrotus purpuratus]